MRHTRIALARNPLQSDLLSVSGTFGPLVVSGKIFQATSLVTSDGCEKHFDLEQDGPRLVSQQKRVETLMADGQWRTLPKIVADLRKIYGVRCGEASVSARLRDMRRAGWKIERLRSKPNSGLYLYRAVIQPEMEAANVAA